MASQKKLTFQVPPSGDIDAPDREGARHQVAKYLQRFGYLDAKADHKDTASVAVALTKFQALAQLPQTGHFDDATAAEMVKPRCGYPDLNARSLMAADFAFLGDKWDHTDITYRFDNFTPDLTQPQVRAALSAAFARWANVTPLTFREVASGADADIRILFANQAHGDSSPFDQGGTAAGNVLAHAFPPGNGTNNIAGDIHFDDFETWTEPFLRQVALHEIGHAIGLDHSTDSTAVMYPFIQGLEELQPDDIRGIQSRYGPRTKGWFNFVLSSAPTVAPRSNIAVISRIPGSMEVFWIAANGSVQDSYWYEDSGWLQFELAPPGSASPGGITAVARHSGTMEVWWTAPNGSVQDAYWYEDNGWNRFELSPPGSAVAGSKITAVARIRDAMEVWWIGSNGSVQDAYWYPSSGWKRFELAPAGSASLAGGIEVLSRIPTSMEVFWVGPSGSIEDAFWYEGPGWNRFQLAPQGSASPVSGITAVARYQDTMEVWWVGANNSVQDANWYPNPGWRRFELASAGSAAPGGIEALSRHRDTMEVWWTGLGGSIEDAYFYGNAVPVWNRFQLAVPGTVIPGSEIGGVSRIRDSMEMCFCGKFGQVLDHYWYG